MAPRWGRLFYIDPYSRGENFQRISWIQWFCWFFRKIKSSDYDTSFWNMIFCRGESRWYGHFQWFCWIIIPTPDIGKNFKNLLVWKQMAQAFDIQLHLVDLYQDCSSFCPGAKTGPAQGPNSVFGRKRMSPPPPPPPPPSLNRHIVEIDCI